jgi:hypothetical protein
MAIMQGAATMSVRGLLPAPSANADVFGVWTRLAGAGVLAGGAVEIKSVAASLAGVGRIGTQIRLRMRGEAWVISSLVFSRWQAIRTFPSPAAIPNPAAFPKRRHGQMLTSPRSAR